MLDLRPRSVLTILIAFLLASHLAVAAQEGWIVQTPDARFGHAMATDTSRGRVVMFGGRDLAFSLMQDTWEWEGSRWVRRSPQTVPPARHEHTLVFDSQRSVTILYGGRDALGNALADVWEWDGTNWTMITSTSPGGARFGHGAAFDSIRNVMVVHGGGAGSTAVNTFTYDGSNWTSFAGGGAVPTTGIDMAFHASSGLVALIGGQVTQGQTNLTWFWNGATWTSGAPTFGRIGSALAYDAARSQLVMFGGITWIGYSADVYEWNGAGWVFASPPLSADNPGNVADAAIAYDPVGGGVILFGGENGTFAPPAATWRWTGTAWLPLTPPARLGAGVAYDTNRNVTVLFGEHQETPWLTAADTWEFDGSTWALRTPATSPPPRRETAMVFDRARNRVVLYGGRFGSQTLSDTWEYDGTTWTQVATTSTPGAIFDHKMAYDVARARVVLVTGGPSSGSTWEYDGTNWTQVTTANQPSGMWRSAIAYDEWRGETILFGGYASGAKDETWAYDGTNWTQRTPLQSPPKRYLHAMAYDAGRGKVVVHGGYDNTSGQSLSDTWEWNGVTWNQRTSASVPKDRSQHDLTYDSGRGRLVGFGGISNNAAVTLGDRFELAVSCDSLGTGLDPNMPPIACLTRPVIGTTHQVSFPSPGGSAEIAVSAGMAMLPPPIVNNASFCSPSPVFVDLATAVTFTLSGNPAVANLTIPNNPALIDTPWVYQGFFLDGTGSCVQVTEGLAVRLRDQ